MPLRFSVSSSSKYFKICPQGQARKDPQKPRNDSRVKKRAIVGLHNGDPTETEKNGKDPNANGSRNRSMQHMDALSQLSMKAEKEKQSRNSRFFGNIGRRSSRGSFSRSNSLQVEGTSTVECLLILPDLSSQWLR